MRFSTNRAAECVPTRAIEITSRIARSLLSAGGFCVLLCVLEGCLMPITDCIGGYLCVGVYETGAYLLISWSLTMRKRFRQPQKTQKPQDQPRPLGSLAIASQAITFRRTGPRL